MPEARGGGAGASDSEVFSAALNSVNGSPDVCNKEENNSPNWKPANKKAKAIIPVLTDALNLFLNLRLLIISLLILSIPCGLTRHNNHYFPLGLVLTIPVRNFR